MGLLSKNAAWRKDPKRVAEMVTGATWVRNDDSDCFLQLPCGSYIADSYDDSYYFVRPLGWVVYDRFAIDANLIEFGTHGGVFAASTALVEAVLSGDILLPECCPGVAALKDF